MHLAGGPSKARHTSLGHLTSAIVAVILLGSTFVQAAEIKVIGGSAVIPAMAELIPQFAQSSGYKVRTDFDGAISGMADRVRRGEVTGVVIVSDTQIDALIRGGQAVPSSRTDIAQVGIGAFDPRINHSHLSTG